MAAEPPVEEPEADDADDDEPAAPLEEEGEGEAGPPAVLDFPSPEGDVVGVAALLVDPVSASLAFFRDSDG
ncbi:MAG TPA: hypothetical protein VMT79_17150 [Candidatus Binatia bacterium]|nr:hypothetical protein [Candidatus Binatia bacterium]